MAVRDNVSRSRENIYTDIPSQFPSIYREEGQLFVEFVQAYYEYVDTTLPKFRDAFYARNVDTTDFDKFLLYFKNKYMDNLPFDSSTDLRFVIKHITDFYRRKGTEESLRLFFRMFFNEEVEVFYPSSSILKLSDSIYGSSQYLEMKPVSSIRDYPIVRGAKIVGDTSKAEAFRDEVIFKNFNGSITPIAFISNVNGKFISDDVLTSTLGDIVNNVGKLIKGSISSATVKNEARLPGNNIGDDLKLISTDNGVYGKAVVDTVRETTTGVIEFEVEDGGYGYAVQQDGVNDATLNDYLITNQVLVVDTNSGYDVKPFDTITFTSAEVRYISNDQQVPGFSAVSISVTAVKFEGSVIYCVAPSNDLPVLPDNSYLEGTNDRTSATIRTTKTSAYLPQAQYRVSTIKDAETVTLIPDILSDFLNVTLNSSDYGMSGSGAETVNTTIRDAFTPVTYQIGQIDTINVLDSGQGYQNDLPSIVRMPEINNFLHKDIGLTFNNTEFLLLVGDVITQVRQIEDLSDWTTSNTTTYVNYTVKLKFLRRDGDIFYFKPLSFYQIDPEVQINIKGNMYDIVDSFEDVNSLPMGRNANITGTAFFASGQIDTITVTDTGYKYNNGERLSIVNNNPDSDLYGTAVATVEVETRGSGFTEGKWQTTTSFLNEKTKVIRDNDYYQEYSYDISSIVNPDKYESLVKEEVSVAGTKLFSSPLINSVNKFETDVNIDFEVFTLDEELNVANNFVEVGPLYRRQFFAPPVVGTDELVATVANIVSDVTLRVQSDINS